MQYVSIQFSGDEIAFLWEEIPSKSSDNGRNAGIPRVKISYRNHIDRENDAWKQILSILCVAYVIT